MRQKIFKRRTVILTSCMLLITTGILACAFVDDFGDYFNSFFAPEVAGEGVLKPFYRSTNVFYGTQEYYHANDATNAANIDEWQKFFGHRISEKDLKYMVYEASLGEVDTAIFYIKNNAFPIKPTLKANSIFAYDNKVLIKDFLFYLGFAKRCEPFTSFAYSYWEDEADKKKQVDVNAMDKLLAGGSKSFAASKTPYLKQRYAFQLIRLYYQKTDYSEVLRFYDLNKDIFVDKNINYFRALGYVAASFYKLKDYAQANYLYSCIFDHCDDLKPMCFLSFHPQDEKDWTASLNLAKSGREKQVLWFLLGLYADPLRAMEKIYEIDPKSELIDHLVTRAVNINEESFLSGSDFRQNTVGFAFNTNALNIKLMAFTEKVAKDKRANKPYLWNLTSGYLNLIAGNFPQADAYLSATQSLAVNNMLVSQQVRALKLVSMLEQYKEPSEKQENLLAKELKWLGKEPHDTALRAVCIYNWALKRLAEKYNNWKQYTKAECLATGTNRFFYDDDAKINEMAAFIKKKKKTDFEEFIYKLYPYSYTDLFEYRAIKLIYAYRFKEALEVFAACKGAGDRVLKADPFFIRINDCHDCDFASTQNGMYSQKEFVEKLINLEQEAKKNPDKAAQNYFLIGNGLYNMTYFGNARDVYSSPIFDVTFYIWYADASSIERDHHFLDCQRAMDYYQKAIDASKDNEFRAKCSFMAAKCEQNLYYISKDFPAKGIDIRPGKYYKALKENYTKTAYYQEIIAECGYFRKYANQPTGGR